MNGTPYRRPGRRPRRGAARHKLHLVEPSHILDRNFHAQIESLRLAGINNSDRPIDWRTDRTFELGDRFFRERRSATRCRFSASLNSAQKSRHFLERPLRRGKSDALEPPPSEMLEPFDGQREMRAALRRNDGVNFINDNRLDGAQQLTRVRSQQKVQRLGRRDENIRRMAQKPRALVSRRISRANRDTRNVVRNSQPLRRLRNSHKRSAQVALNVYRESLDGRDINDAAALRFARRRRKHQPVNAPQKRRERFPRSGGRENQRGIAARYRRPAKRLRPRERGKHRTEPLAHSGFK